jgi:type IV fimbrial biogenesis protein FimT
MDHTCCPDVLLDNEEKRMLGTKHERGFTLIELIIGFVVVGILFMIGLPNFSLWLQNAQIRTAAESIQDGLQLARSEAVRMNSRVSFSITGNDWSVDALTPASNIQSHSGLTTPNATVTTPQNAIVFTGMGRVTSLTNTTLNVTNANGSTCQGVGGIIRCLNVNVLVGGSIRLCDPALPALNPQSC